MLESPWLIAALWVGLALLATLISIRTAISVALIELIVGAAAGNVIPWVGSLLGTPAKLEVTPWVNFLAGAGAIILTFLAGAEIDPVVVRKHFWSSMSIGTVGFFAPFFGVLAFTHYVSGWPWPQAQIGGIALSTTSVAVVYAVMVETGFNRTEIGKIILAACFINDLGTVLALACCSRTTTSGWWFSWWPWESLCGCCPSSRRGSLPRWATASASRRASSSCWCCSAWADWATSPRARRSCPPTWWAWFWRPTS